MNLNSMLDELTKLSRISLFTLIPLTAAFILTSYLSNSLTILSLALDSGVSIVVQAFAFNTIRAMKPLDQTHGEVKSPLLRYEWVTLGKHSNHPTVRPGRPSLRPDLAA